MPVATPSPAAPRFLRPAAVEALTGLKKSQRYKLEAEGGFPQLVKLSERAVAYIEAEVVAWMADRVKNHRAGPRG